MTGWPVDIQTLVERLGAGIGIRLSIEDEAVVDSGDSGVATALGSHELSPALTIEVVAKVLLSEPNAGEPRLWALVFVFLNSVRVAPPERAYMTFAFDASSSEWTFRDWEADIYEEWTGLERLT